MLSEEKIIKLLNLEKHPCEGGFFKETYRSRLILSRDDLHGKYPSGRNSSTAIYYLLSPETFSEMHVLTTDEIFHFYLGDPVEMLQLAPNGESKVITLGTDILKGQVVQALVPAGVMQGAKLVQGGAFALLGCTVSPGFDYEDYGTGNREELIKKYPQHQELITQLTHSNT